jgi:hypothetical protein
MNNNKILLETRDFLSFFAPPSDDVSYGANANTLNSGPKVLLQLSSYSSAYLLLIMVSKY